MGLIPTGSSKREYYNINVDTRKIIADSKKSGSIGGVVKVIISDTKSASELTTADLINNKDRYVKFCSKNFNWLKQLPLGERLVTILYPIFHGKTIDKLNTMIQERLQDKLIDRVCPKDVFANLPSPKNENEFKEGELVVIKRSNGEWKYGKVIPQYRVKGRSLGGAWNTIQLSQPTHDGKKADVKNIDNEKIYKIPPEILKDLVIAEK